MRGELLPSAAEMRDVDAREIAGGTAGYTLMQRAGRAVADRAASLAADGRPILVLCGPGHNGGDGFVAARMLKEEGRDVVVACLVDRASLAGDARAAAGAWDGEVLAPGAVDVVSAGLVIDALFGTGLARDLGGDAVSLIEQLATCRCPILAVDVPSGIGSDTGLVRGAAVRATHTVALAARKPGHLLYPGRAHAGRVEVAGIGIARERLAAVGPTAVANGPLLWSELLVAPRADGHKYDRGHAVVLSGGPSHTGAARLCARGALRAGAGLVTLVTSARALSVNAAHLTAIMLQVADEPNELADLLTDERFNAVALGPALGVGEATRGWVEAVLEADRGTVLDADALTSFSGDVERFASLLRGREAATVLTPHEGEFKRLLAGRGEASGEAAAIAAEPARLVRARRAASFLGAVVVLKGPDTIIAAPDGRAAINENGSPHLATAGSGDVLGGTIAGLLARGLPGFEAAAAAVWIHAAAADRFGPGLIAEDIAEVYPAILSGLYGGQVTREQVT